MRLNKHLLLLIIALIVVGSSIFFYRWSHLHIPLQPSSTQNTWIIDANLRFQPSAGPIKATFYIPQNPPNYNLLDELFVAHNYGVAIQPEGLNRLVTWTIRRTSGMQSLYYRAIVYPTGDAELNLPDPDPLQKTEFNGAEQAAVDGILTDVRNKSADINTFAAETIKILNNRNNNNANVILNRDYSPKHIAETVIAILSHANIHAQLVKGIYLTTQPELQTGLVVFNEQTWTFFDPENGQMGLPQNFLIWQYGPEPITTISGGSQTQFSFAVTESPISAINFIQARTEQADSNVLKFSLFTLPVKTQYVYQILLTLPVGAFVILLLRNFIGIKTFGTFMPVLIALAFRETQLFSGIIMFTLIVSVGLMARFYLDQLRLLLIPRLTAILTIVILVMMLLTIVSQLLGLERGLSIALFPIVIITMTIERMSIVWDERGPSEAIISGIGSLVAASIAYLVMNIPQIEYLAFAFPELLFVLLALILWLGQYQGYRLTELRRFKALIKQ